MFEWYLAAGDGLLDCSSGYTYKTEGQAIWHGKKWLKETGRRGKITAVKAEPERVIYIADY